MASVYRQDLAYIHDVGFGGFAADAAPGILRILGRYDLKSGLVVDLGCGSGILAKVLVRSGYRVMGVDASTDMIRLARQRVPEGEFVKRSLHTVALPACAAVTAIGESLNYRSASNSQGQVEYLFLTWPSPPWRSLNTAREASWKEGIGQCLWRDERTYRGGCLSAVSSHFDG